MNIGHKNYNELHVEHDVWNINVDINFSGNYDYFS